MDRRAIAAAMYRWTADLVAIVSVVVCLGRIGAASAAEPTLHLEGKGTFEYLDACSQTSCPAILDATLDATVVQPERADRSIRRSREYRAAAIDGCGCSPTL